MGLLDWIKGKRGKPFPEPENEAVISLYFSKVGSPITPVSHSEWYPDAYGIKEYRYHLGRSEFGFHGGLQVSIRGGEGPFEWSSARPTAEEAKGLPTPCVKDSSSRIAGTAMNTVSE